MPVSSATLTAAEVCTFFESLPPGRKELVWVRCERLLGSPLSGFDPSDERIDEAFDRVLTDMWCSDQLERLVALGRLTRDLGPDGNMRYMSAHAAAGG